MEPRKIIPKFWYRNAKEFDYLKTVSKDGAQLADSYARWLQGAENGIEGLESCGDGSEVFKAEVDPEAYLAWCWAEGRNVDSHSRTQYANLLGEQHFRLAGK
jgi:hypothetical protein